MSNAGRSANNHGSNNSAEHALNHVDAKWDRESPSVLSLIEDIKKHAVNFSSKVANGLAPYLISLAQNDGVIPTRRNELDVKKIAQSSGLRSTDINNNRRNRDFLHLFASRFLWENTTPRCFYGIWNLESSHVKLLINNLEEYADRTTDYFCKKAIGYLLGVAKTDGILIGKSGYLNYTRFFNDADIPRSNLTSDRPTRKMLDLFYPSFILVCKEIGSWRNLQEYSFSERITIWLKTKPLIPCLSEGVVSFRSIASILRIPTSHMEDSLELKQLVLSAIESGYVKINSKPIHNSQGRPEGMSEDEANTRIAQLKSVVLGLEKLPESPSRTGCIDLEYIADLTGQRIPTMRENLPYRNWLRAQAKIKGLALPGYHTLSDSTGFFRDWGLTVIEEDAKIRNQKSWMAKVRNYKTYYTKLLDAAGLTLEDEVGDLFGEQFQDLIIKAQGNLEGESAANVRRGLEGWAKLRLRRLGVMDLPKDLPEALRVLVRARGLTVFKLAQLANVKHGTLIRWVSGESSPSRISFDGLRRVESALALAPGVLTDKARYLTIWSRTSSSHSDAYQAVDYRIKQILPPDASAWDEKILNNAVEKLRPLLTAGTPQGSIIRAAASHEHLLEPFKPNNNVMFQIEEFVRYKVSSNPYPFFRSKTGRWRSDATKEINLGNIKMFFRFVAQPQDGRLASGMGVDPQLATIAWLGCTSIVLAAAGHRAYRFHDEEWGEGKRGIFYTAMDVNLINIAMSMTHPETGWLTQNPEMAETLVPLANEIPAQFADLLQYLAHDGPIPLLSEKDIQFAKSDWLGFMSMNYKSLAQAKIHVEQEMKTSRDPLLPIIGLFSSPTPMADLITCALKSQMSWRPRRTSKKFHAIDVRNSVMVRLACTLAFRPKNLVNLTFDGNMGQIRKINGRWEVEVPYTQFKNWRSCRLFGPVTSRRNFYQVLDDEAGLYNLLDYYFFDVRNILAVSGENKYAFIANSGRVINADYWHAIVKDFGRRNVAWNPVKECGLPGVASLSPYAFRHIKASDILQNSIAYNKVEEAAFALQTSELMIILHYGMLLPNIALESAARTFSKANLIAEKRLKEMNVSASAYLN